MRSKRRLAFLLMGLLVFTLLASPADAARGARQPFDRTPPEPPSGPILTGGEDPARPVVEVLENAALLFSTPYFLVRCFSVIW